jgi:hypothetical protein
MMKNFMTAAVLFALSTGCAKNQTDSALQTSLHPDTFKKTEGVELEGPTEVDLAVHSFYSKAGDSFTINIDKRTIKACYSGIGYTVSQLEGHNQYLVEIDHLMVPAVVCHPSMTRDIELGASINISGPQDGPSSSSAKVYVWNKRFGDDVKVEIDSKGAIQAYKQTSQKFDSYNYSSQEKAGFDIEVDHHMETSCGPSTKYSVNKLKSGGNMVLAHLLPQRHYCPESSRKERQLGATVRIPESKYNWNYGSLLVSRTYGDPLKVEIKGDRKADRVLECNIYDEDGPIRELRLSVFSDKGMDQATATIESRSPNTDQWFLDYSEKQTTIIAEGKDVDGLLAEGLTSYPNYRKTLNWSTDPRLKDRCWDTLPNYDIELNRFEDTPAYTGKVTVYHSMVTDPLALECLIPEFSPAPPAKPQFIKCGAN